MENREPSEFLKKLHNVVTSGDPTKGLDVIKKINEIHKLADGMTVENATTSFNKRIESGGLKNDLTPEEIEKINLESERSRLKFEDETLKNKMLADVENLEFEIRMIEKEFDERKIKYQKIIDEKKENLKILNIKFKAKYEKD